MVIDFKWKSLFFISIILLFNLLNCIVAREVVCVQPCFDSLNLGFLVLNSSQVYTMLDNKANVKTLRIISYMKYTFSF